MGRRLCIGANPSVVLDFMKAGKCVSVSKTFIPLWEACVSQCWCALVNGSREGGPGRWGSLNHSLSPLAAAFLIYGMREALLCPSVLSKISTWVSLEEKTDVIEGWFRAGCLSVNYHFAINVSLETGQGVTRLRSQKRTEAGLPRSSWPESRGSFWEATVFFSGAQNDEAYKKQRSFHTKKQL